MGREGEMEEAVVMEREGGGDEAEKVEAVGLTGWARPLVL